MARGATAKVPALHNALKSAAFGVRDGVDVIAGFKNRYGHFVAGIHFQRVIAEFLHLFHRFSALFFEMTTQRLWLALGLGLIIVSELNGVVAICFLGALYLQHAIWAGVHHGDAHGVAVCIVHAGLPQFFANQTDHLARKF